MLRTSLKVLSMMTLVSLPLAAQDSTRHVMAQGVIDTTRIGIMSPMVVQQRLRQLGYSQVSVVENVRTHVRANAIKAGKARAVKYDPHTGKVTDVPGRYERRANELRLIKPGGVEAVPPG